MIDQPRFAAWVSSDRGAKVADTFCVTISVLIIAAVAFGILQ